MCVCVNVGMNVCIYVCVTYECASLCVRAYVCV